MSLSYEKEEFLALFGMRDVWEHLEQSPRSTYATIVTDLDTGAVRALLLEADKTDDGFDVQFKYLLHHNSDENDERTFFKMKCVTSGGDTVIDYVDIDGHPLDVSEAHNSVLLPRMTKNFSDAVINKNEWLNPVQLLSESGLQKPGNGKSAWPGLYVNGDIKTVHSENKEKDSEPVYPVLFLPAVLGVGQHNLSEEKTQSRVLTLLGQEHGHDNSILKYTYTRGSKRNHFDVSGHIKIYGDEGGDEQELYKVEVRPNPDNPNDEARIKSLTYMGKKIDLSDSRATGSVLKVVRNVNRMIRAGDSALIEDMQRNPHERRFMLPTDLNLHMGVYPYLNDEVKIPKQGIMTFAAIGGNNQTSYVSEADQNIGANQYIIGYESKDEEGQTNRASLMIDAGVLFHDIFDVAFFNAGRYLKHKHDNSSNPEEPVGAILFTHRHKDHLGQLAYLVKKGYELPPLVMNEITMLQFKRDMSELDIEAKVKEEILEKCYPINLLKDINPQDPEERKETEIAGTKIEQWTEALPGRKMGSYEYYPRLKINDTFDVRVGPMPHSDPGLMFDIVTPAGSHRHTGDYKWDDTIELGIPPLDIWMRGHEPDSMSGDSTGTTRPGENILESDVKSDVITALNDNADNRFIFPTLGSNITRLGTLISAMGETSRKTLIIDGKAVEDLVKDADKVYDLKKWAKDFCDVDIIMRTEKKKVEPFLSDPKCDGEYAILVTGTQDEPYSALNRAARDALPAERWNIRDNDIIAPLQGVIPTGDNAFRRMALKDYIELYHKARVILPEAVDKEAEMIEQHNRGDAYGPIIIRHSSGHNNEKGVARGIVESGLPFVLPVHGDGAQLGKHADIASEVGARSHVVTSSMQMRIEKGKKVTFNKMIESEFIGVTNHTPAKEKFYLKGRFSTSLMPIKPQSTTDIARLVDTFEHNARQIAGMDSEYEMARSLPVTLSRSFNAHNVQGFLKQDIPFGIDKYTKGVFAEKNIHAIGAADTETGGLSQMRHLIREFALTIQDVESRKTLENIQLFQQIPDYRMSSPFAMLVTNTKPKDLDKGMPAYQFVDEMNQSIRRVKEHSHAIAEGKSPEGKVNKNHVKALIAWHNTRFDSKFIAKECARNLDTNTRLHQTYKTVSIDTRTISRALAAYQPGQYHVAQNPVTGFPDHTLESLCKENGVDYDAKKAHGGQYDTNLCMDLFWKQYDIASDITEQMIINADSSTSHLLNDMMGMDMGFNGPHPIFSYVSPSAARSKPQMGCFVGTMDTERYAVVFNLKYDPDDYLYLPARKIADMLADYDNDVFEVLDLRQNPVVVPARYGLRVNANGNTPKETLDRRAGVIKTHLNYVDPQAEWKTIAQKINEAWQNDRESKIFTGRILKNEKSDDDFGYMADFIAPEKYPDLEKALDRSGGRAMRPEHGAQNLLRMRAKVGINTAYRSVCAHVRDYLESVRAQDIDSINAIYRELVQERDVLEATMDTINFIQYDIDTSVMSAMDHLRVEDMRHFMAYQHYNQADREIASIESNPDLHERYVGESPNKAALFKSIKKWVEGFEEAAYLPETTKQFMNPQRKYSRAATESRDDNENGIMPDIENA
ncbi:MAG: exonuclease domain-containing protein [Alphaproteobacteria bacterium]